MEFPLLAQFENNEMLGFDFAVKSITKGKQTRLSLFAPSVPQQIHGRSRIDANLYRHRVLLEGVTYREMRILDGSTAAT